MPRFVLLAGVGLVLVAVAFLVADAALWRPGPSEANARRVLVGMTVPDVEALLGPAQERVPPGYGIVRWWGKAGYVDVFFGEDGRAYCVIPRLMPVTQGPTLVDRLRTLVGR